MSPMLIQILFLSLLCFSTAKSEGKVAASESKTPVCGSITKLEDETVVNVTHRAPFKIPVECLMYFETQEGYEISMEFEYFVFFNRGDECNSDYLQFGNGEQHDTKKYCTFKPNPFRSNQTKIFIRYNVTTDGTQGFTALLKRKKAVDSGKKCPVLMEINDNSAHDVSHHISEGNLQTEQVCRMKLQTNNAYVLKLQIEQLEFPRSDKDCTRNYLKFGDTERDLSKPYCKAAPKLVLSAGSSFILEYLAEDWGSNGFKAKVTRTPKPQCNESIFLRDDRPVNISHELEKLNLVYNEECTTKIFTDQGFEIELRFNDFYMPSESNVCTDVYVKFDSGDPRDTHKYCRETPHIFFSQKPAMFLTYFVKDRDAYGFTATLRRIKSETIDTDSLPTNGPSTESPSKPNHDATDTSNTDQQGTTNKQTSKRSSTTRTHVNLTTLAAVLFLLISF